MQKEPRYFDNNSDDLTGWPVHQADGSYLGRVARMLADADTNYVVTIVLDDGRELPARDLIIGASALTLAPRMVAAAKPVAAVAKPVAAPVAASVPVPKPEVLAAPPPVVASKPPVAIARSDDDLVLELIGEELDVGKRSYEAGGVHLETHIVSEPITKEVRLHEERVTVQRTKVDRKIDAKDANVLFRDGNYEVKATSELPVVRKFAHVVEEVVVKRKAFDHDEIIREKVRLMDADITELRASEALQGARR